MEPLNCSSAMSNDLYGIGVRVGIYCIWLTSWLANNFVPSEISGALDANAIFLLALIASIIRGTSIHGSQQLRYIDGLILMHLCAGYIFGCFSIWGYRTAMPLKEGRKGIRNFGGFGTHCRLVLCAIISIYGCWFWIEGVEDGLAWITNADGSKKDECYPLTTFFFAKLPVMGNSGIRIYYIVVTVACALYFGCMVVVAAILKLSDIFQSGTVVARGKGIYDTGLTTKELKLLFLFCRYGNLLWTIFAILMVEMTLNFNHVTDVIGLSAANIAIPSQLLPLLVGILGLVRVLYIMYKETKLEYEIEKAKTEAIAADKQEDELEELEKQILLKRTKSDYVIEKDEELLDMGIERRYMVALLPWLSLTGLWQKNDKHVGGGTSGRRSLGDEELVSLGSGPSSLRKGVVSSAVQARQGADSSSD